MNNLLLPLIWAFSGLWVPCLQGQVRGTDTISYGLLIARAPGYSSSTQVSPQGTFELCNLPIARSIDILLYRGPGSDTLYLGSVVPGSQEPAALTVPANVRTNIRGHFVCPKCNRADKTAEIIYGDGLPVRRIVIKGDTTYTSLFGRKMHAGCIDNGTKGYCQRDRILF
jgi:hypothetical protein